MQFRRVNRQVACRDERIHADSTTHYVICYFVDERVRVLSFAQLHVRIPNRKQSCVQNELLI